MSNHNLTSENLDLVLALFMAQDEESHPEFLTSWFKIHGSESLIQNIEELKDKNIILKQYKTPNKGDKFDPNDIEFNKNFLKSYLKHSGEMGFELFSKYPSFTNINGKVVSLKNISKYFSSLDDFFFSYGKAIKFNPERHKEVLSLLDKAIELNIIHYGILEFVVSQKWITLKEEVENGVLNYDTKFELENDQDI